MHQDAPGLSGRRQGAQYTTPEARQAKPRAPFRAADSGVYWTPLARQNRRAEWGYEMTEPKRAVRKIPVRKISRAQMRAEMEERIRVFERRYEMSSENMDLAYSLGLVRETAEIVEWLQVHQMRKYLDERESLRETTPTNGTPMTDIE